MADARNKVILQTAAILFAQRTVTGTISGFTVYGGDTVEAGVILAFSLAKEFVKHAESILPGVFDA
jgi:hypothetical protein